MQTESRSLRAKMSVLRGRSPADIARILGRRFVYDVVWMDRYAVRAADCTPVRDPGLPRRFLGSGEFAAVLGTSPHLSAGDVAEFTSCDATCTVLSEGDRIVGSMWSVRGAVFVPELRRSVDAGNDQHYCCRAYVHPAYRGRNLLAHMLATYAAEVAADDDELWSVIYRWNVASARSLQKLNWRRTDEVGTVALLGRSIARRRVVSSPEGAPAS